MVALPAEWVDQKCQGTDNLGDQLLANSSLELGYKCPAPSPIRWADPWDLCQTVCHHTPPYQNSLRCPNKHLPLYLLSGSASGGTSLS